tara:strand:+ start:212 stop:493 length:282 start_codon:yes stop_codon:yes gene_type:complete
MIQNHPSGNIRINEHLSLTPSQKEVPTALSLMVDSMASMLERAKQDLESVDQRARADLMSIDQRARKDVARLDQKAREDHERLRRVGFGNENK